MSAHVSLSISQNGHQTLEYHEDLSRTIETNKTTTTPRNINSNNAMH